MNATNTLPTLQLDVESKMTYDEGEQKRYEFIDKIQSE